MKLQEKIFSPESKSERESSENDLKKYAEQDDKTDFQHSIPNGFHTDSIIAEACAISRKWADNKKSLEISTVSPHRYTMCHGGTVGTGKSKTQTHAFEFASCFYIRIELGRGYVDWRSFQAYPEKCCVFKGCTVSLIFPKPIENTGQTNFSRFAGDSSQTVVMALPLMAQDIQSVQVVFKRTGNETVKGQSTSQEKSLAHPARPDAPK